MSMILDKNQVICGGFLESKIKQSNLSDFCCSSSSSSSSSIGMNSDDDNDDEEYKNEIKNINFNNNNDDEDEVESKLKKTSFDSAVDALEQALPIRRGISSFYTGKSRSFASLSDTRCLSVKDIAKPENAYSRKRKGLLAYRLLYQKDIEGGTSKRCTPTTRPTLALAVAMSNREGRVDNDGSNDSRISPSPWRSFSVVDFQNCAAASAGVFDTNLCTSLMRKRTKLDRVS